MEHAASQPAGAAPIRVIDLETMLTRFEARWTPHIVGELNGQHVKLAKLEGPFVWHAHAEADELFLVLSGRLTMELRDGDREVGPGQMLIVPRGVEHRPVAHGETHVLLFEPAGTLNTGDAGGGRTVEDPPRL